MKMDFGSLFFVALFVGLVFRIVCSPTLSYEYDDYSWAVIVQNINSGDGLYGLDGYFYTPGWGYVLGAYDFLWSFMSPVGDMAVRVMELFGIETLDFVHSATAVNPLFLTGIKIILILCDLAVGYLVYREVSDATGSRRKAEFAFALWFLCPIVMYMSGVQCMFDCVSALAVLLCVMAVRRDNNVLGGMLMAAAVMLKVLPGICLPILLAYIIIKNKNGGNDAAIKSICFVASFVAVCATMLIPDLINGDLPSVLAFATGRMFVDGMLEPKYILYAAVGLVFLAVVIYLMISRRDRLEEDFNLYILCALAVAMVATGVITPQYCIVFIPFLAMQIAVSDKGFMVCWWLIAFSAAFNALVMNNFGLLTMAAKYYGIVDYNWIMSMMSALNTPFLWTTVGGFLVTIGNIVNLVGTYLIFVFTIGHVVRGKSRKLDTILNRIKSIGRGRELTDES